MTSQITLFRIVLVLVGIFFTSCNDEDLVPLPVKELVALAGPDQSITQDEELILDASATENANKKPFSALWSIKIKPQGSDASIASPQSVKANFIPDLVGQYVVRLTITKDG